MAEIFLFTRGHSDHVDKWKRSMKSQFFPMKFKKKMKDEYGKEFEVETTELIEAQLRPYQLWGYVVPEQYVQPICNNLGIPTKETWFNKEPGEQTGSFISGFGVKGILEAMRLILGAEKIPEIDLKNPTWSFPIYKDFVNILGIGWRRDSKGKTIMGEHELI